MTEIPALWKVWAGNGDEPGRAHDMAVGVWPHAVEQARKLILELLFNDDREARIIAAKELANL